MKKYNYKIITLPADGYSTLAGIRKTGKEGWRVIQITRKHNGKSGEELRFMEEVLLEKEIK